MMFKDDDHDMDLLDDRDPNDGKQFTVDKINYIIRKDPVHVFWYVRTRDNTPVPSYLEGSFTNLALLNRRINEYKNSPELRVEHLNKINQKPAKKPAKTVTKVKSPLFERDEEESENGSTDRKSA